MAEPHWTSYVGMVTGIIGSIAGLSGAILGIISYRRSNKIKSLDLRIELKKTITDLYFDFESLEKKMRDCHDSRLKIAAPLGLLGSSFIAKWEKEHQANVHIARIIRKKLPNKSGYDTLSSSDLENKIAEAHQIHREINALHEIYDQYSAWDREKRQHLHEQQSKSMLFKGPTH